MPRLTKIRLAVAGLVTLSAAVGLFAHKQHKRYTHFAVHEPGRVYRSAWVDDDVFAELIPKYKIRTVVNLCLPGEMGDRVVGQRATVHAAGAKLLEMPFPLNDTWDLDYEVLDQFKEVLADETNYPIWIHCQHGRERTVKALVMYDLLYRDLTAIESLDAMPLFGMAHPWPVVVFAFNYQDALTERVAEKPEPSRHR